MPKKLAPVGTRLSITPRKVKAILRAHFQSQCHLFPADGNIGKVDKFVRELIHDALPVLHTCFVESIMQQTGCTKTAAQTELGRILGNSSRTIQRRTKR